MSRPEMPRAREEMLHELAVLRHHAEREVEGVKRYFETMPPLADERRIGNSLTGLARYLQDAAYAMAKYEGACQVYNRVAGRDREAAYTEAYSVEYVADAGEAYHAAVARLMAAEDALDSYKGRKVGREYRGLIDSVNMAKANAHNTNWRYTELAERFPDVAMRYVRERGSFPPIAA